MKTDSPAAPFAVEHRPEQQRFEVVVDGQRAELDYRLDAAAGVMSILHTGVAPRIEGRGVAAALTRAAIEHARASGWKVQPLCSYARAWMQRHPEAHDLRA